MLTQYQNQYKTLVTHVAKVPIYKTLLTHVAKVPIYKTLVTQMAIVLIINSCNTGVQSTNI